jgi:hypothetical protein
VWHARRREPAFPSGAGDHHYIDRLCEFVAYDDAEREALKAWVLARTRAMCRHQHFRYLHERITEALNDSGELDEAGFRREIERAHDRYIDEETAGLLDLKPSRIPEEPTFMPRTPLKPAAGTPTLYQCHIPFAAIVNGEEKIARHGDIYRGDDPLVRHSSECFCELGDLPNTPQHPMAA